MPRGRHTALTIHLTTDEREPLACLQESVLGFVRRPLSIIRRDSDRPLEVRGGVMIVSLLRMA
jgi:hypothetical protein